MALTVVMSVGIRIAYVLLVLRHHQLGFDSGWYHDMANNVAAGRGYSMRQCSQDFTCDYRATAYFPPLFPLVLTTSSVLGFHSLLAHQVTSCLIGGAAVAAVGFLGRRLGGPTVGLVAAGVAAVHPMFVAPAGGVMAESLYLLVVSAALLAFYRALDAPTVGRWIALGLLIGAAALTRSEGLALLVLAAIPLALLLRLPWRRRLGLVSAVTMASILPIVPWVVRNSSEFGETVVFSTNANTVIRGANCPSTYHGSMVGYWDFGCLHLGISQHAAARLDEVDSGKMIRRAGLDYATGNRVRLLTVSGVRLLRTWGLYNPLQQARLEAPAGRTVRGEQAGWLVYVLLMPLAAAGFLRLRRTGVRCWPLAATVSICCLQTLLSYGAQRWRVTAEPALVVCAAVAITDIARSRRSPVDDRVFDVAAMDQGVTPRAEQPAYER